MASVPAWKQTLLERRRDVSEVKQRQEIDNSLPTWKRELLTKRNSGQDISSNTLINGYSNNFSHEGESVTVNLNCTKDRQFSQGSDEGDTGSMTGQKGSVVIQEGNGSANHIQGDDSVPYQPGFVNKLLNKFSHFSVQENQLKKRAPSLESVDDLGLSQIGSQNKMGQQEKSNFNSNLKQSSKYKSMDNIYDLSSMEIKSESPRALKLKLPSPRPHIEKKAESSRHKMQKKVESPRPRVESFLREDIIIIESSPPVKEPIAKSDTQLTKACEPSQKLDEEETVPFKVSEMKNMFEKSRTGNAKPTWQKQKDAPLHPEKTKHNTTENINGDAPVKSSHVTIMSTENRSSIYIQKSEPVAERKPQGTSTKKESSIYLQKAPVNKPQTEKFSKDEKIRTDISETSLESIRHAGKSWFFSPVDKQPPAGSEAVKISPLSLPTKQAKTAVNQQWKQHLKQVKENNNSTTFKAGKKPDIKVNCNVNPQENGLRSPRDRQPTPLLPKRPAPQPPNHAKAATAINLKPDSSDVRQNGVGEHVTISNIDDIVIVNSLIKDEVPPKSSLSKATGKKLRIQFNDHATLTYEYPSEKIMLEHMPRSPGSTYADDVAHIILTRNDDSDEDDTEHSTPSKSLQSSPAIGSAGSLSNYQSRFQMKYEFGMNPATDDVISPMRPKEETPEEGEIAIKPADEYETAMWSDSTNTDMLF